MRFPCAVTQFQRSQIAYAYAEDFSIDTETANYDLNHDVEFNESVPTVVSFFKNAR